MRRRFLRGLLSAALVAQMVPMAQVQAAPVEQKKLTLNRNLTESVKAALLAKAEEARKSVLAGPRAPFGKVAEEASDAVRYQQNRDLSRAPYAETEIVRVMVEVEADSVAQVAVNSGKTLSQLSKAEIASLKGAALSKVQAVIPAATQLGGQVRQQYGLLLPAFSMEIENGKVEELRKLPGVKSVTYVNSYQPENKVSAPLIGAAALHAEGYDGTGTVIAIVDTGINYSHEAFGAQSNLDPNGKVIGGWNFADNDAEVQSAPGTSPHGTHVAGTAAGIGPFAGVAPGAKLLAQKVFSNNPEYGSAYGDDILAALEDSIQDTSDRMDLPTQRRHPAADVINMSLGSPSGWVDPNDASIKGTDLAVRAGVVVSISAGNSSYSTSQVYNPYYRNQDISTLGSPSVTPYSISVAASHNNVVYVDGSSFTAVVKDAAGNPVNTAPYSSKMLYTEGSGPVPFSSLGKTAFDVVAVNGLGCDPADVPASVAGKVALVSRGSCTFQVKADNAAAKGAVAVLVYNNASDDNGTLTMATDAATVPTAMLFNSVGMMLKNNLVAGGTVKATFNGPAISVELPGPLVDTMTTFSSWGTAPDLAPKPDVTAPGQNIKSPTWGPNTYENYQGTSMAAPHVAGASALLKQAHPEWGPAEIKLALMNTAKVLMQTASVPFSPRQQGAGRIQLVQAESTPVLAAATTGLGIGTGHLALGQVADKSVTSFSFELSNLSDEELTYSLPASTPVYRPIYSGGFNALVDQAWTGAAVTFSQSAVTVPAHGTATVTGQLNLSGATLHPGAPYGHFAETFVKLTAPFGKPNLSLPLTAFAGNWAAIPVVDGDPSDDWCYNCQTGVYSPVDDSGLIYQSGWNIDEEYDQDYIAISPNGDGTQDEAFPVLTFMRNAKSVTIDVKSSTGKTLRRLAYTTLMRNLRAYDAAPYVFSSWDGNVYNNTTGTNAPVEDGEYLIQVKAMPATGSTAQTYTFPVKVDRIAPTLTIDDAFIDEDGLTIDWTADDENSGIWGHAVFVNGELASLLSPGSNTATVDLTGYEPGSGLELMVITFDNAGNVNYDGGYIDSEATPPNLTIFSPQQKQWYDSHEVVVDFATDPDAVVYVNDGETPFVAGDSIILPDGEQFVTFRAVDEQGNETLRSVSIYVDTTAPEFTLTNVPNGGTVTTADSSYTLMGTVEDALLPYSLKVNGSVLYEEGAMADEAAPFHFAWTVEDLADGANVITIETEDAVGNYARNTVTITKGAGTTALNVTSPVEGTWYNTATIPFTYTSDGTVYLDGEAVASGTDLTLGEGDHTINVDAVNGLNVTRDAVTFHVDLTAPVITLTGVPESNEVTTEATTYELKGTVSDAMAAYDLTVNGAPVLTNKTGSQSFTTTLALLPGENTFVIEAQDAAGNVTTRTITVTKTPALTVTSPEADGWYTSSVAVSYTADPGATVKVDGADVASGTELTFAEGTHTINVTADLDGAITTRTVTFHVDTTAPVVTVTSAAATENETYLLTGTVADANLPYSLTVNGEEVLADVSGSQTFSVELTGLVAGTNDFTIVATDKLGNSSTTTFTVTRNAATISGLALDKEIFSASGSPVKGSLTLPGRTTVTVLVLNGEGQTVKQIYSGTKSAGTFNFTWNARNNSGKVVADGIYTIVASTSAGGYLTKSVEVDSTKPTVTLATSTTDDATFTFTATTAVDTESVKLSLTGAASKSEMMTKVAPGQFEATITLTKQGAYRATATATDAAGNYQQSATTAITADLPPTLSFTGGATVTSKSHTVKLSGKSNEKLDEEEGLVISVEGFTEGEDYQIVKTSVKNTSWSVELEFFEDDIYAVAVSGTDLSGKESAVPATKTVVVDTEAPILMGYTTMEGYLYVITADLSGVKPGSVKVKVGSSSKTATLVEADGFFAVYRVALPTRSGSYNVYVSASDVAGNVRAYPASASPDFTLNLPDDANLEEIQWLVEIILNDKAPAMDLQSLKGK